MPPRKSLRSAKSRAVSMMLPVKEEEADDVSSFNADESAKRYKPSPPALGTVMVKTNIDQREQSAKQIQRVWRTVFKKCRSQIYAQSFLDVLTMDYVKSISFEALVILLREKPVVKVTRNCVQRIHLCCTFLHGSPRKALDPEHVNVRVVLAAYMIAGRPTHVFESMGALEQSLYESALVLTTNFESLAKGIAQTGAFHSANADLAESFPTVLFEYLKRFKAWKVPDEAKLICRIKHALIALYQAREHLPHDEPDDSKLKVEFRIQIERLRSKLQQIGGVDALAQFDEACKNGKPSIPPGESGGGGGGAYSSLPGRMTNEQLAHELLLDPTFQLSDTGGVECENPVFHRIRASFHQAFWDSLVDDLKLTTPCYVRVLRVLAEIRDGIAEVGGGRVATTIREAVDTELIKQQAESGAFGWDSCMSLVGSVVTIIKRVQAPGRDSSTRERWKEVGLSMQNAEVCDHASIFCRALEFILDLVNILRIDAANARLRLISPVIKDHGIDYERGKFQDKISDGTLTLVNTEAWIKRAVLHEMASNSTARASISNGDAKAFVSVHLTAMVSLIVDTNAIKQENVPETLLFDVNRISILQRDFHAIVDGITVLTTATHAIVSSGGGDQHCKQQVLANLAATIAADSCNGFDVHFMMGKLGVAMDSFGILKDQEARGKVLRVLTGCVKKDDAVRQLIASRVRQTLIDHIRNTTKVVDAKLMSVAKQLIPLVEALVAKLYSLADINRAVHTPTYNRLIAAAVDGDEAMAKTD